jgi:eukaryotic-like serine/threonine-protein kinase
MARHGLRGQVLMIGQRLGTFLIEEELGSGSMGTVYRGVRDSGKRRIAAIKVIGDAQIAKREAFKRFVREIRILRKLRHPNIVRYMAHGKSGKTFYYAMEFVPGPTLEKRLANSGPLFWVDVVRYAIQICDALHYSHENSVVHRDLKPSNLMLTPKDNIKLTDFGIAKDMDATRLTGTGRAVGTAAYMAPEQFGSAHEISHKSDLYALGVMMYQMLTGELPFNAPSILAMMKCHAHVPAPRASAKTRTIPVALDNLVLKLMAKSPQERPLDAVAVATVLRSLLARRKANKEVREVWTKEGTETAIATPRVPIAIRKKKPRKSRWAKLRDRLTVALPTLGLLAGLVVIGALIVYTLWWPSPEYLYSRAKTLMASEDRTDWLRVPREYLDDLDRWYPDHKYKSETDAWRDRIALSSAERRGDTIARSPFPDFRKTTGEGEDLYAAVFPEAEAALKRHADADAARSWREMASRLEKVASKSQRGWLLLANRNAARIEAAIADRASEVANRISEADQADRKGFPDKALEIRRDLVNRFGKYTATAEALNPVRKLLRADQEKTGDRKTEIEPE